MNKQERSSILLVFSLLLLFLQILIISPNYVKADIRVIKYPEFQEAEIDINSTLELNIIAVFTSSVRTSVQFVAKYEGNWSYVGFSALLNNLNITSQIKFKKINNTIVIYNKELTPPTGRFSLTLKLKPMEPGDYNLTWAYTFVTLSSLSSEKIPIPMIKRDKGLIRVHVIGIELSNKSTHISEEYSKVKVATKNVRENASPTLRAEEVSGELPSKLIVISNVRAPSKVSASSFYIVNVDVTNLSNERRNVLVAIINEYTGELIVSCQIPVDPNETANVAFGLKAPTTKGTIRLRVISGHEGVEEDSRSLRVEII